jgi:hypothetical protein
VNSEVKTKAKNKAIIFFFGSERDKLSEDKLQMMDKVLVHVTSKTH